MTSSVLTAPQSGMSRKTAIAGMAIASITAVDNWRTHAFIAAVAIAAILIQGLLDWHTSTPSTPEQ